MYHLYVTTDIYRICQIFVARFRIWGGLSNALGRLSLQKPPRGAGAGDIHFSTYFHYVVATRSSRSSLTVAYILFCATYMYMYLAHN